MSVLSASGGSVMPGPVRIYTEFEQEPIIAKKRGAGAATGTAADLNVMIVPSYGLLPAAGFQYEALGTQTIVAPILTADGLDFGLDQTDNDGWELNHGITARNPMAFVVGTDGACYLKCKVLIADVSGADPFLVGFRKAEAYQGDFNSYDELAAIGIMTDGSYYIETILNNAATVDTDTTQNATDATAVEFGVFVSAAGVVTFTINGVAPTVTKAFTFDTGEVIIPFAFFLHGSDVAGTVELQKWDCGAA